MRDIVTRLNEVTAFYRFETNDRVAASICLSEEAADTIKLLRKQIEDIKKAVDDNLYGSILDTSEDYYEDTGFYQFDYDEFTAAYYRIIAEEMK